MARRLLQVVCLLWTIWDVRIAMSDDFKTALARQSNLDVPNFLALKPSSLSREHSPRHQQHLLSPVQWRSLIEQLLEVRCSSQQMTILLHSARGIAPKSVEDTLRNGRILTEVNGSTVAACGLTSVKGDDDSLVLKLGYDDCGIQMEMDNDTVLYKAVVVVEATTKYHGEEQSLVNVRQSYPVQCVNPVSIEVQDRPKFSFALSSDRFSISNAWTYPHTMNMKSHVFLSSNVTASWQKHQNVYSYPIDCWSSPAITGVARTRKKYFMRNGCSERNQSYIYHFTNGPTPTKVSVEGTVLVFDDLETDSFLSSTPVTERMQSVMISCDVIPCTHSSTTGILDIPKCPPSYFCSAKAGVGNNLLPARLRGVKRTNVAAGPVTVRERKEEKVTATTVNCAIACRRTPTIRQSTAQPATITEIEGVSLRMAMVIAFASFIFGILFMGALWCVHVRTDPKRLKILQDHYNWQGGPTKKTTTFTTSSESSTSPRYQIKSRLHDSGCHSIDSSSHQIRESISPSLLASTSAKSESIESGKSEAATARLLMDTLQ